MGPVCLQYMLPRIISKRVELPTKVVTGLELDTDSVDKNGKFFSTNMVKRCYL